jgi:hypothetical protein
MMDKEQFLQYIEAFNKGDHRAVFSTYYTEDAVFETPDVVCDGRESIINFIIKGHTGVNENISVKNILIEGDRVAAELEAEMQVTADRPDHHIRPSKKGDLFKIYQCAFYDLKDGKFCNVRVYRRKVTVL